MAHSMVGRMSYIASNERLITHLSQTGSCVSDFMVYQFRVFENDNRNLIVDVYLKVLYRGLYNHIKLRFTDIKEYFFSYKGPDYQYNIKAFSFLKEKALFYLSFDMTDTEQPITQKHNNFIFAHSIEGFSFHKDF